ncbi:hypothetical protein [Dubosiella newyorkensis]|jgi:hypothetical protein|uniref:DUF4834 domain-containing protein n=1 Tax=Dubosiella newyorkensis TaxID=1862672 RepID=A0A1U7NLR1_9FIRM|nr:hypothetical protein [Dubosiella newyorkensis]MCI9041601.1 hypothetical protein [Dubosiella newyorkensis]OLU45803.1 hypothetical protein BO225_07665 [Dubosiella newyorkensis]
MQFLILVIAVFITFLFAFYILPVLIPFLIFFWVVAAIAKAFRRNKQESDFESYYRNYEDPQPRIQPREARPDSIDVDYVEYEESDDGQ